MLRLQNGSIHSSPDGGARIVRGAVRDLWEAHGWELSALGYPVSEEVPVGNGAAQRFQGGDVLWSASTGPLRMPSSVGLLRASLSAGPLRASSWTCLLRTPSWTWLGRSPNGPGSPAGRSVPC